VLAERFVIDRNWTEERAVELGTQVLRGNTERIFRWGEDLRGEMPVESVKKTYFIEPTSPSVTAATGSLLTPHDQIRIEPPKGELDFQPSEEVELGSVELDEPALAEDAGLAVVEPTPEQNAATLDLGEEHLERLDELAAESVESAEEADSGMLSLEEPGSPEAQETFSFRQTEPTGKGDAAQQQPAPEAPGEVQLGDELLIELPGEEHSEQQSEEQREEPGPDNWDFLNTRKK
jgi:hypothetical protein